MKRYILLSIVSMCITLIPVMGQATQIYMATSSGNLAMFETTTGVETTIGFMGIGSNVALSFAPDDTLYGLRVNDGLYTIDINTGTPTLVGNPGVLGQECLAFDLSGNLYTAASYNSTTPLEFFQLNVNTGAATSIGTISGMDDIDGLTVAPVSISISGFGTFSAGTFFAADTFKLYAIDPDTLIATLIDGSTKANETLAFGPDGTLYMHDGFGEMFRYDFNTMSDVSIGTSSTTYGMAVQSVPDASVMLLLGSSLMGLAVFSRKRKKS